MIHRHLLVLIGLLLSTPLAAQPEPIDVPYGEAVRQGTGETALLLIPCASCRWRSFDEFMERNADRYTMYAVTLPGYGGSRAPDLASYTRETPWQAFAASMVIDLLRDEGVEEVVIVGNSFGTMIALEVAAALPDVVTGLVNLDGSLTNSVGMASETVDEQFAAARAVKEQYMDPLDDPDRWQRFNTPSIHARPDRKLLYHGWFMATDPVAMTSYWWENFFIDRNPLFRALDVPVLDVQNLRPWDETPEATRRAYEATIAEVGPPSQYRLVFLYETPHFLMEERPELLDRIVADFVAGKAVSDFRPEETERAPRPPMEGAPR